MSSIRDDELMLLWRQGTSAKPDQEEIARLAGLASIMRFDRLIFWRNFLDYALSLAMLVLFVWNFAVGDDRVLQVLAFVFMIFYVGYLWWYHHDQAPLDPSADGQTYQNAMLARFDKQIHLLSSIRYAGLPLGILNAWVIRGRLREGASAAVLVLILTIEAGVFVWIVWMNERSRWGIPRLRAEREKIEKLYKE